MRDLLESNRLRRLVGPAAQRLRQMPRLLAAARRGRALFGGAAAVWPAGAERVDPTYQVAFRALLPAGFSGEIGLVAAADGALAGRFDQVLALLGLRGRLFDPARAGFHDQVVAAGVQVLLCRPGHRTNQERQMAWEKILPLFDLPGLSIFPERQALNIYEAKRELAYFLRLHRIAHPPTEIFYDLAEALDFASTCPLPQVFKTNTGSAGAGVEVVHSRKALVALIREVFRRHYVKRGLGERRDMDYGHVLLQAFLPDLREFRVIKVGPSWFSYEKLPGGRRGLMSGSGRIAWTVPPAGLLEFCADLAARFGFTTMCFDIFQSGGGPWLVNELQSWFGSYDNSQMYLDGVPGRYLARDGAWAFEPGYFNQFGSLPLILTAAISAHMQRAAA